MTRACLLLPDWTRCVASEAVANGALSGWCARADRLDAAPGGFASAVREVLPWGGTSLPAAALSRQIDVGDAAGSAWLRADPAHVRADMATARMLACGALGLSDDESAEMARELMPIFGDAGFELDARLPNRWYLRANVGSDLPACGSPDEVMGDDLKLHLPQGAAGKRWRQLFNDSQIILHNHPVNARRAARGAVSVNSLWFWGAGVLPVSVRGKFARMLSDNLELRGLGQIAGISREAINAQALEESFSGSSEGDLLIDLTALRNDVLESFLQSVNKELQRQTLRGVDLLFGSGERFRLQRFHRLRFWRRIRELRR